MPLTTSALFILRSFAFFIICSSVGFAVEPDKSNDGRRLAKQFCQACHQFSGTDQAGTIAPPLLDIKARFPDRKKLYNIIYDPQVSLKPHTMMPPFGRNELLAKEEIEKIIEFLYTL